MKGKPSLDEALDGLFERPPNEFIHERTALAKALEDAGDSEAAQTVRAQKRPTLIAFALNQLRRTHSKSAAALVTTAQALRREQRRAVSGADSQALRERMEERRALIAELADAAADALARVGKSGNAHRAELFSALLAASSDERVSRAVAEGHLSKEPSPAARFGDLAGMTVLPGGKAKAAPARRVSAGAARKARQKAQASRRVVERLQKEAARKRRAAEQAARSAEQLEARARGARHTAERLAKEADEVEQRARKASQQAKADEAEEKTLRS